MPSIPKGAKISEEDKKKLERLKKKGATKSELSTMRMALLRGNTYRKAMMMMKKKSGSMDRKTDKKSTKPEVVVEEEVVEE
jgi:hypothetical protein